MSKHGYAVQIEAVVQNSPPQITLNWEDYTTVELAVWRKLKTEDTWTLMAFVPDPGNQYIDNNVQIGVSYEYAVGRYSTSGTTVVPYAYNYVGYVNSGIEVPAIEDRGKVIIVVDEELGPQLCAEIEQFERNLYGDGWGVIRIENQRHRDALPYNQTMGDAVFLKNKIKQAYYQNDDVKSVILLGHLPYIKSGNASPDGHGNRAFSADSFYGDMDYVWTDYLTATGTSGWPYNQELNYIGDGKMDHNDNPSDLELSVGRIDFYNLAYSFTDDELELTRKYLQRNHAYRHKQFTPNYEAFIMEGNCGGFHADPGWKNYASLVGANNVSWSNGVTQTYKDAVTSQSYIWSNFATCWDCGTCNGILAVSVENGADSLQTVFAMNSGSFIGDFSGGGKWMQGFLGNGTVLTNVYTANVDWNFHHMGLGEDIGYSYRTYFNKDTTYPETGPNIDIIANLLGDPTLRMYAVEPPTNLTKSAGLFGGLSLSWTPSTDPAVIGYYVYRFDPYNNKFVNISGLITGTSFEHDAPGFDQPHMVRSVKLETTPSGSFYNLSQGIFEGFSCDNADCAGEINPYISSFPNCNGSFGEITYLENNRTACVDYCPSVGNTLDEFIEQVEFGGILNITGDDGGYGDYTNLVVEFEVGSAYDFLLVPGFNNTLFPEYWKIMVDFNKDGDFLDTNEVIYNTPATTGNSNAVLGTFVIPQTAIALDTTVLRIAMQWNSEPPVCGAVSFGEVEDYTVVIKPAACTDTDGDGVPNNLDQCEGFDDHIYSTDGVPTGCDLCPNANNLVDSDGDGIPNLCDPDAFAIDCPVDFIAGSFGDLRGTEFGVMDYETDGGIQSTQILSSSSKIDYDSDTYIEMNAGFTVSKGAQFCAFIDGCDAREGGLNLVDNENGFQEEEVMIVSEEWQKKLQNNKQSDNMKNQ